MEKKKSYKEIREEILSGKGVIKLSDKESIAIFKDLNKPQPIEPVKRKKQVITKEYLEGLNDTEFTGLGISLMKKSFTQLFNKRHKAHDEYELYYQELIKRHPELLKPNPDATKS